MSLKVNIWDDHLYTSTKSELTHGSFPIILLSRLQDIQKVRSLLDFSYFLKMWFSSAGYSFFFFSPPTSSLGLQLWLLYQLDKWRRQRSARLTKKIKDLYDRWAVSENHVLKNVLLNVTQEAWRTILEDYFKKLEECSPERVQTVLKNKGCLAKCRLSSLL